MASSIARLARDYRSLSPWREDLSRDVTGSSLWRAKSRLAERCGSVAMASYVSPGRTMSEQTTGLRTFSPKILFFIMLSPKFDWNNNIIHILGSVINSYINFTVLQHQFTKDAEIRLGLGWKTAVLLMFCYRWGTDWIRKKTIRTYPTLDYFWIFWTINN